MATPTNGNGNVVDEFEEAFHACLLVLTKEDEVSTTLEKDEIKMEIDQAILKFLDLARQMEAFFLQKRFLLSTLKPELIVKEDIGDLRHDLARKDELIKRHYDKIAVWQNLLADLQGWAKSPAHAGSSGSSSTLVGTPGMSGTTPPVNTPPQSTNTPGLGMSVIPPMGGSGMSGGSAMGGSAASMGSSIGSGSMQMNNMQQMAHQQQLQQQMQMQHMQGPPGMQNMGPGSNASGPSLSSGGNPMMPSQQAMYMQQQNVGPRGSPFSVQGPSSLLQGPLAYLEKTTSNIGMPDGRR